jgi:hypothetical protein
MDQNDRAQLIDRPYYWGRELSFGSNAFHLLRIISKWSNVPDVGWFLYEVQTFSDNILALALTHLYRVTGHKQYFQKNGFRRKGIRLSDYISFSPLEDFTTYILKSETDGRYYELSTASDMRNCRIPNCETYKQVFSSSTLDEAIERARNRFPGFARMFYTPGPVTCSPPISRFISFNVNKNTCVNKVWTLKNLCLFIVRNYIKTAEEVLTQKRTRTPWKQFNVFSICDEVQRRHEEREKKRKLRIKESLKRTMLTRSQTKKIVSVRMTRTRLKNTRFVSLPM